MRKITATTPGKLIITGEHSVVYGCPALAIPSHLLMTGTVQLLTSKAVEISSSLMTQKMELTELAGFKNNIDKNYQAFLQQKIAIRDLLPQPTALLFYTVACFASQHKITKGLKISLNSEIPMGSGMGSSAATIVTILTLLYKAFEIQHSKETLSKLAKQCENLQHGKSSGLDIAVSGSQTPVLIQNAMISPFKRAGFDIYVVNTGVPISTTGDCVNFVKNRFDSKYKEEFTKVSSQIIKGLIDHNFNLFKDGIHQNQLLLEKLGVVPTKVTEFRKVLHQRYSASFKISGAGSILGDKAGMGLVISKHDPTPLCSEYGYQVWKEVL